MDLKAWVREVPDHPIPGILFKDVTSVMGHPPAFRAAVDWYADQVEGVKPDVLAAIDARGFVFAAPVADRLGISVGFVAEEG